MDISCPAVNNIFHPLPPQGYTNSLPFPPLPLAFLLYYLEEMSPLCGDTVTL